MDQLINESWVSGSVGHGLLLNGSWVSRSMGHGSVDKWDRWVIGQWISGSVDQWVMGQWTGLD